MAFIYKTFKTRNAAIDGLTRVFDPALEMLGPPHVCDEECDHDHPIHCDDADGNEFGVWDMADKTWTAWVRPVRDDDAASLLKGGWIQEAE